jgi:phage-related baseplate assembly protein
MRVGDILLASRAVSVGELARGLERAERNGQRLGSALMAIGCLDADQVAAALSALHGVPPARDVDLRHAAALPVTPLPNELVRRLCVLPVALVNDGRELVVAMRDPRDLDAIGALIRATGLVIRPTVASEVRLRQGIEGRYALRVHVRDTVPREHVAVPGAARRGHLRGRFPDATPAPELTPRPALARGSGPLAREPSVLERVPLDMAIAPRRPVTARGTGGSPVPAEAPISGRVRHGTQPGPWLPRTPAVRKPDSCD